MSGSWLIWALACSGGGKDTSGEVTGAGGDSGTGGVAEGRYFPDGAPWYRPVDHAPIDSTSGDRIAALQQHGWGLGRFQMDFSIEVLEADAATARLEFQTTGDFYSPDCDHVPVPVPEGGNLEGEAGYACAGDGDCHLIVADRGEGLLYEMWRADIRDNNFRGGCLAVWEMAQVYPPEGRGDQCTSADAAGYPIAPLLFTADEVVAGEISHAIRFALPNTAIQHGVFYHLATHATNSEGGGVEALPYGARLRLRAGYDVSGLDPGAQVIARALQTYGMVLADGGNVTLMGRSDARTAHTWREAGIDSHSLDMLEPQDFELVELEGVEIPLTFDCRR